MKILAAQRLRSTQLIANVDIMKNLNKENLKKKNASQPYKLEVDCPYSGGRNVVAYGSRDDLEVIKSITDPKLKPVIVKNV